MEKSDIRQMAARLKNFNLDEPARVMEVCGTHTTEFFKTGVKKLFPENLRLISGPGCPVCVTPNAYIDRIIEIGKVYKPIFATFGDMINIPASRSSLKKEKAEGLDVEIVYSPLIALNIAEKNPDREVVFLSVGFETTVPTEALTILEAKERNLKNFSLSPGNKLTPPAVKALLSSGETRIDGFILPGHVSAIIGVRGWRFIAEEYGMPCVVAGFEDRDLVGATLLLAQMLKNKRCDILNAYTRVVKENGNERAQEVMDRVFSTGDAEWRGIGVIPESACEIREGFGEFDAFRKFPVSPPEPVEPKGCRCGEVLTGLISPIECGLFAKGCTPEHPVGPCMVSTEGSCAAYYKYGR
jgi:hydrogenase expression/formation protein HypD